VPDDGRVDQHVQRFGRQHTERGNRQPEDAPGRYPLGVVTVCHRSGA
jgi:hypothetical protein